MELPITMDPQEYGNVRSKEVMKGFIRYIVIGLKGRIFEIDAYDLVNQVTLLGGSELKWTDTYTSIGAFKRDIYKSTIYFMDGEVILRKQQLSAKYFNKMKTEKEIKNNFITMDIETIKQSDQLTPYLICAYNGKDYITSFSSGNSDATLNQKLLFKNFIDKLITFIGRKSNRIMVYAHNLSGFDGIFLMKHLLQHGKVKPLIFNGKIMCIEVKLNKTGKTIVFKDSYLLLPYSLRKLCSAFKVNISKGWFPFGLNDIFYKGVLPAMSYWNLSIKDYETLVEKYTGLLWSFQDEAIKYCKLDCKCLHEIITIFNNLIFNKFKINIHSSLSAPALAMRIYKTHFMPENTICQLLGKIEQDIRQSYTGGAVDVYIPHNKIGSWFSKTYRKLYYYDVNSLYPTVMAQGDMPIGAPTVFEGNIRQLEPSAFGFFYCKITSPNSLIHPILQRRIQTKEGIRTVAGLGTWTGWISSVEMDNAIKFGYQFEIIKGYTFDKGNIFKEYINTMYELRLEYSKDHPMNLIAKLMMNSIYGKLGMRNEFNIVEVTTILTEEDKSKFKKQLDVWGTTVKDWILLEDHLIVIRDSRLDLRDNSDKGDDSYHGIDTNIAIASTITSEARIYMSYLKNNHNFHLYYSDTDSIVIDCAEPDELVGNNLGQLKLEYVLDKAVFLAPKVYGLITEDGGEIIKIKGITPNAIANEDIHFNDLALLLNQDSSREFTQEKWYKSITQGTITVSDIAYTLKATSNKRRPVYVDGIYEDTTPYFYNEIEVVKNNK